MVHEVSINSAILSARGRAHQRKNCGNEHQAIQIVCGDQCAGASHLSFVNWWRTDSDLCLQNGSDPNLK